MCTHHSEGIMGLQRHDGDAAVTRIRRKSNSDVHNLTDGDAVVTRIRRKLNSDVHNLAHLSFLF
jgi:hypothetical protein